MSQAPAQIPAFHVLIAAAGRGARMGSPVPKQYRNLAGKPVLRHSIETLLRLPGCLSLTVIIDPHDAKLYHEAVSGLDLPTPIHGSDERNKSIYNGLKELPDIKNEDLILIHDAARPCLKGREIEKLLEALLNNRAACLAAPLSSTLRRAGDDGEAAEIIPRDSLWALQTPQGFRYGDILDAHRAADPQTPHTDDTRLVSALGIAVKLVEGSETNIKITRPEDFELAQKILNEQPLFLTGTGFDVHAFSKDRPGPVRLCGVDVPSPHALEGHSDADVGLHALTDAILGAIGEGDIGRHFPPSNDAFKNMDSAVFLEHALNLMRGGGGTLVNIDITLICETPKIGPHAEAMRARLAALTGLPPARVNVKATTTEKLGFTGRGEGIAAQAAASVLLRKTGE